MRRKQRVLIVEDNADLRRLFAIGLNQRGYEVRLAANGAEAVDRVEDERPDVILLDLIMPVMDGWEVIERVNAADAPNCIPVIVVSAHERPADRPLPSCIEAWVSKPATLDELAENIRALTAQRRPHGRSGGPAKGESRRKGRKSVKSASHGDGLVSHP